MNENESSRGLVAGELERLTTGAVALVRLVPDKSPITLLPRPRATEKAACPMCDLYEIRERQLRQNVRLLELQYADLAGRMDDARRWKSWCLTAALVLIVVVGGLAVKP